MSDEAAPPPPPRSTGGSAGMIWFVLAMLLAAGVAGGFFLLLQARKAAMLSARIAHTEVLIDILNHAVKAYEVDFGALPPGNGAESADFAKALGSPGPGRPPYYLFKPGMLDRRGNIVSPIDPSQILRYRNNRLHPGPRIHNPDFDLWCPDGSGAPDGCNNW